MVLPSPKAVAAVKAEEPRVRSASASVPSSKPITPSSPDPKPTPRPVAETPAPSNGSAAQLPVQPASNAVQPAAQQQRPSALTSVIYPVLSKLLKQNQEEGVIAALAQLKIAFDNAERAKPGITHQLIAQIIETLKR